MMRYRYRTRHAPAWWPENEPWPPVRGARWRTRTRFARRLAFTIAIFLLFSAIGATRFVSWIAGAVAGRPVDVSPLISGIAAATVLLIVLSLAMRRFGMPLGDMVGAADRLATGDFSARMGEHGPPSLRVVARAFNGMATRLQRQEQQRRELMADIAHELRTPLTVIQGRLEGLIDGVYERDDEQLAAIADETRMLARLVDDLQTLARTESGTFALDKEPTDVGVLINDVVRAFAQDATTGHVALEARTASDLPLVAVDPLRMREVLTNLVSNALRHTSAGEISISADVRDGRLVVAVRDTGTGIPPDELSKIFDRFYKGDRSHGTGLGLTIAKNLVEAHGGEIRAESRVGSGTTMTFTLPTGAS
jgi:two-component system OmpR family sensor kinase/two-component system sensor histidine kinase BaeS